MRARAPGRARLGLPFSSESDSHSRRRASLSHGERTSDSTWHCRPEGAGSGPGQQARPRASVHASAADSESDATATARMLRRERERERERGGAPGVIVRFRCLMARSGPVMLTRPARSVPSRAGGRAPPARAGSWI